MYVGFLGLSCLILTPEDLPHRAAGVCVCLALVLFLLWPAGVLPTGWEGLGHPLIRGTNSVEAENKSSCVCVRFGLLVHMRRNRYSSSWI